MLRHSKNEKKYNSSSTSTTSIILYIKNNLPEEGINHPQELTGPLLMPLPMEKLSGSQPIYSQSYPLSKENSNICTSVNRNKLYSQYGYIFKTDICYCFIYNSHLCIENLSSHSEQTKNCIALWFWRETKKYFISHITYHNTKCFQ